MSLNLPSDPTPCRLIVATADIAGFAKTCRERSDLETFRMLDAFYRLVTPLVEDAGGRVVKFMGDAALMVFPEAEAVAAVGCLQQIREQAQGLWAEYAARCVVHTKGHVGPVVCGPLGPTQQFDVIGNTLNELFLMPTAEDGLSEPLRALAANP